MASIEATDHDALAQNPASSILFPAPPALCVPAPSSPHLRPRVDSHFGFRPALAALQNTFTSRRRTSSVSDAASQHSNASRSPHLARFVGLDSRPRAGTSASLAPPSVKSYTLDFPIIESPDEATARAPRIPSFHMEGGFGHELGLSLGLNPRFSTASTVRAQSVSPTPEEARRVKDLLAQSHLNQQGASEASQPPSGPAQDAGASCLARQHPSQHHADTLTPESGFAPTAPGSANPNPASSSLGIDTAVHPVADRVVADITSYPAADLAYPGPSHAQHESDLYMEGVRALGSALPTSPIATSPLASGASSPVALRSTAVSPTPSISVSPIRSIFPISPTRSIAPMGSTPSSPVHGFHTPALAASLHSISFSTSHIAAIPFPSAEENEYYASDDANDFASYYAQMKQSDDAGGYDTPTLYTGTTNTSPTLSVTRVVPGEVPPALRLGPGTGFAGVGTYAGGGGVQGGVFVGAGLGAGEATRPGLLRAARPGTADSGVSGFGRVDADKDGERRSDSLLRQSSNYSVHAESSGQSTHAESSSGTGPGSSIRARVTSLRTGQALSGLIPAFMKRARRKSRVAREESESREQSRGRKEKGGKKNRAEVIRAEESRARTESTRTRSMSSSRPISEDEDEDVSPAGSQLDLLSEDPFASTVALKVGAWSEMYASTGQREHRRSANTASRDSGGLVTRPNTRLDLHDTLPPLPDSASTDDQSDAHVDYSSSLYGDDDSEEESSICIYSHGCGRSLSQPDVNTVPIEPLHQSTTSRRSGSSLGRRRRPALPPRPSLPSLSTLSRTNVAIPMPRSSPAARFPAEPWDNVGHGTGPASLPSSAGRGLGSLVLPVPGSPHRAVPRSPMRSRMGSVVGMSNESSIAEGEEDESESVSTAEDDKVWWSGPSSRRSSFRSHVSEEDTVSMPIQAPEPEGGVRESVASTAKARDSVTISDRLSQGSIDVASDAFLQKLDELDSLPTTPPPSDRTSSDSSFDTAPILNEMPIGVGPRNPTGGIQGNGGGASGGYPKQSGGDGWKGNSGGGGGYGYGASGGAGGNGGNGPRRQAPVDSDSSESSSDSELDAPPPRRGRDARGRPTMATRSQSVPRQPASTARVANRKVAPAGDSSDESDNVPLAQRIPTALRAQKSIRIQDQAGREERRQKRLERMQRRAADKTAPTGGEGGIAPDDLAKRLLNVQVGGDSLRDRSPLPSPRSPAPASRFPAESGAGLFPAARSRTVSNVSHMTRSRTHTRNGSTEQQAPPVPFTAQTSLSRSGTMSGRRPSAPEAPPVPIPRTSLSRNGTVSRQRASQDTPREQPGASLSRNGTAYRQRNGSKTDDEGESSRFQRTRSMRDPSGARPPMPPMPPIESLPLSARRPSHQEPSTPQIVEQRVYIGDRQKFVVVDVGSPNLTARDVLDVARQRGELDIAGVGGWQLWEQSNECGMERPIRDFEYVSDVLKAWNPEKRVNVLIIRRSQMCGILKPENIPSSSPTMSGWVMWAARPGKWSKRWLELKEHSLFVCKNDKGKDQTLLCTVSAFDGYIVTHVQRAPKGFVFAAKSTESLGVFEKEEDSSHIFSCDREIGEVWLQKILLARSYVLQQERAVYTRPFAAGGLSASKSLLSRSGTKKSTVSSRSAASQNQGPLVQDLNPSPFIEGSLLAKASVNGV